MNKDIIILKYNNDFADNLSSCAYANILKNKYNITCFRENKTKDREAFENKMLYFDLDYKYISSAKVEYYVNQANKKNFKHINSKEIFNKRNSKNKFADLSYFQINDIDKLNDDFLNKIDFSDKSFIKNHDILERIEKENSIGLYLNEDDFFNKKIDFDYINKSLYRLNKYVKKPKIFIFTKISEKLNISNDFNYQIINLSDWIEEFYFLICCKHKIIINSPKSYSMNLWGAILNQKSYHYAIYDKKINTKTNKYNWIGV